MRGFSASGFSLAKIASTHVPFGTSSTSNPSATFFSYMPPFLCSRSLGSVVVEMSNPLSMMSLMLCDSESHPPPKLRSSTSTSLAADMWRMFS